MPDDANRSGPAGQERRPWPEDTAAIYAEIEREERQTARTKRDHALSSLLSALGYKPLSRTWAKAEILLGLTAFGVGVLLGQWTLSRPTAEIVWEFAAGALVLIVLGGYLALAGHRSHLYQSSNERTAYLAELIRRSEH